VIKQTPTIQDLYRATDAQQRAVERRRRPKLFKLEGDRRPHDAVAERLAADYYPQQVANRLAWEFPDDPEMRVSHETIYQTLFVQARGELRTQLRLALRSGRAERRPQGSTRLKQARIAGMVSISERPAEAADRAVPGHWEGDLILGKGGRSQILTLVERQTRFVMLAPAPDSSAPCAATSRRPARTGSACSTPSAASPRAAPGCPPKSWPSPQPRNDQPRSIIT